jgi:hypothetical protein
MLWVDKEMSWQGEAAGKRGHIMAFCETMERKYRRSKSKE